MAERRTDLPKRAWRTAVLVVLGLSILAIAAAETLLRQLYFEQLKTRSYPDIVTLDARIGYRYKPNARSRFCVPSICKDVVINEHGFPGPSFARRKPEGVYRVAVVGTSSATGIWQNSSEGYPERLQRRLNEAGYDVEVINLSIDGRGREFANLRFIQQEALKFEPDLILLEIKVPFQPVVFYRYSYGEYYVDAGHSGFGKEVRRDLRRRSNAFIEDLESSPVTLLYDASYIFRAFCRLYVRRSESPFARRMEAYAGKRIRIMVPGFELGKGCAHCQGEIERTLASVARVGSRLLLFSYGYDPRQGMWFNSRGFPWFSLGVPRRPALRHEHDSHPNEPGLELIADLMFQRLTKQIPSP